eukprot:TRINITY_DN29840_c0_g1_i1.p1 TRINITY_DN29840_c0_g1~~TRINITY_DN29840_c0_g1_i1.p1  ORF type:complete len:878 (+),score=178.42 TRINITY_DN29840_c0_g1_i1:88-2721(+)
MISIGKNTSRLLAAATLSAVLNVSGEPYVVYLARDRGGQVPSGSNAKKDSLAAPVGVSIAGNRFSCELPASARGSADEALQAARYAVARKAGAFAGTCLVGHAENTGEAFELCVGDRFVSAETPALHQVSADRLLPNSGGFEQHYASYGVSSGSGGGGLRATVNCSCSLPSHLDAPSRIEAPRCQPGELVLIGPEFKKVALVTADRGDSLEVRLTEPGTSWEGWIAPREELQAAKNFRSCENQLVIEDEISLQPRITSANELRTTASVATANAGEAFPEAAHRSFEIELQSVTCCSAMQLQGRSSDDATGFATTENAKSSELALRRLLSPLEDRCLYAQNGWWSYELCWPFSVRQIHFQVVTEEEQSLGARILAPMQAGASSETLLFAATESVVGSTGATLGRFGSNTHLELRRSAANNAGTSGAASGSRRGSQQEVVVELDGGDACKVAANTWQIELGSTLHVSGAGGFFNPVSVESVEGKLAHPAENLHGCESFEHTYPGAVLIVKRGECFFHQKAMKAEEAGAAALLVYNDDRPPVETMEGVEELVPPRIPTVFIHADKGEQLLGELGERVTVSKVTHDGLELSRNVTTKVTFRCTEDWQSRRESCQAGDHVDVKLWAVTGESELSAQTQEHDHDVSETIDGASKADGAASPVSGNQEANDEASPASGFQEMNDRPSPASVLEDSNDESSPDSTLEEMNDEATPASEFSDASQGEFPAADFQEFSSDQEAEAAAKRIQEENQQAHLNAALKLPASLKLLRAVVVEAFPKDGSLLVRWAPPQEQDPVLGNIPALELNDEQPLLVPMKAAYRDGTSCAAAPTAYIEKLLEPYSCQAELVVHVASLCAHPRLAPPRPREAQAITCVASDPSKAPERT